MVTRHNKGPYRPIEPCRTPLSKSVMGDHSPFTKTTCFIVEIGLKQIYCWTTNTVVLELNYGIKLS